MALALAAGTRVDTVGVFNLAEGDTLNLDRNLTIIETTRVLPPSADGGEVFAWEFYAAALRPVRLLIFRWSDGKSKLELVGEGRMVVPRQLGLNRMALPEPIPVGFRYMMGIYQPEEGAVPFKKIRNWKTLIRPRSFERPFTERDAFVTYGWRYSYRVFWRQKLDS